MEYDIFREKLAIKYSAYGHALWKPNPGKHEPVEIGDVGFIRRGHFHFLFNVLPPKAGGPDRGPVPPHHEPFKVGNSESPLTHTDTLRSNHFCSNGVSKRPKSLTNVPHEYSFSCSTGQGAILFLPISAQREDILAQHEFGKYMAKHVEEWFTFARSRGVGIVRREDIVLVTGRDLAKSWANIVFQDGDGDVTFEVRVTGDSHIEWKFTLEDVGGVAYDLGPSGNLKDLPENQCIFVRGFRATRIAKILPRLRAAAGPVQAPSEDDLDADMQLISIPGDTQYQDPFYTLLKYIAIQAPNCDLALIHDDDLQLCIDGASLDSLQPDTLMTSLRRSAPKVRQVEWGVLRKECSPIVHSSSTAEALPQVVAVKVAMLSKYTSKALGDGLEATTNFCPFNATSGSSPSKETPPNSGQDFSRWLPTLREIKVRIEQSANGGIERLSHLDQSESSDLSLRRWAMRLLMSAASLSPADFALSAGYLGPPESTPYYPTGDLGGDRSVAYTTAMNCLEDLEVDPQGNDPQIASKLFELVQALSDLGLRESALDTCGYASEYLYRLYIAEPTKYRLRVASVLSLRANILCDLKRNNEAMDAADRAVTLCKEHKNSQAGPVPELAYALLNYAVLLCSMGLKDESAAAAFELLCEDDVVPEMENIFALCALCISTTRVGIDDDMGIEMAEETIESSRMSSDANSQTALAGALLAKSKILSSTGQNDAAPAISAEAVTILRRMRATHPVFSLFLAHALDTHAYHLSRANRKGESYVTRQDAVRHWQALKTTAGDAVTRPLAWSLFRLAKFRSPDEGSNTRREELQLAESAVDMFRQVVPLDAPGLGEALYQFAARMLELDDNREAATYAEESIQYFREASAENPKYEHDLILSLSLASSCLACTERGHDAFEYAKQAVELRHRRKVEKYGKYDGLLRKLLMDVVARAVEIDRHVEVLYLFQKLLTLGGL